MRLKAGIGALLIAGMIFNSCDAPLYEYPVFSADGHVNMVVEIPAGTNKKYEFNPASSQFELELIDNKERVINFLPYPGNYGFVPSTLMDESKGGDGDALDILLISHATDQGKVIEVIPVAVLQLSDRGEKDDKVIAVPADPKYRIIKCVTLECLESEYPKVLTILQEWFTNYKGPGLVEFKGWLDEKVALKEIKYWKVNHD